MRLAVMAAVLVVFQTLGTAASNPAVANVKPFTNVLTRFWVEHAVKGAATRLRDPECLRVLADFSDADGRPLSDNLATVGLTAEEYLLTRLWFVDGIGVRPCDPSLERMAITQRGSHVVFICPRFLGTSDEPEVGIIHELLHSLGLGENPPSSRDITKQVVVRCGR